MSATRTINIGESTINKAIKGQKFFDALTFVLKLKATYHNSCLYQWSINKVAELCHCNKQKAKEVISTAFKMGWIKERITNKGREIYAPRLYNKKESTFVFQITDSKAGKQIYIGRFNKRLKHIKGDAKEDKAVHFIVSLLNNGLDEHCQRREKNKKKPQTFSNVRDIILGIIILDYIKQYEKQLNTPLTSSRMGASDSTAKKSTTDYLMYGLPIEWFKRRFNGLNLSAYQITRIIHNLKRYGLLNYKRAKHVYLKLKEGDDLDISRFDRFNERTGRVENVFGRCWRDKRGDPDTYYIYEAYIYKTNAMTTRKSHKPHKKQQVMNKM